MSQMRQTSEGAELFVPGLKIKAGGGLKLGPQGLEIDCLALRQLCNFRTSSNFSDINGDCGIAWSVVPTQVGKNQPIVIQMAGLSPGGMATAMITPLPSGSPSVVNLQADNTGTVTAESGTVLMDGPEGNYEVRVLVAGCKLGPEKVQIEVVDYAALQACNGYVTVTPTFNVSAAPNNSNVALTISLNNTNSGPVTVNLPQVVLPAGLTSTQQIGGVIKTVQGGGSEQLNYMLSATNSGQNAIAASLTIPANFASYVCNGSTFSAGGGAATVQLNPTPGPACGLVIQSFSASTSTISSGNQTSFVLVLKNTGTNPITNLSGTVPIGGNGITSSPTPLLLAASNLTLAPGASHTLSATASFTLTDPGAGAKIVYATTSNGVFSGTCNGTQVSNSASVSTTVTVTP
jgi:hypothetical protein